MPPLPVEWVRLDELVAADQNPKLHDIAVLMDSIRQHGYVDHSVLDRRTNQLVGGHGRAEALQTLKDEGSDPIDWPCLESYVHVDDGGDWWVPSSVTRTRDEAEASHLLLALNSGDRPGWDPEGLTRLLAEVQAERSLAGTGYTDDDVTKRLALETDPPLPDTDEIDLDARYEVVITCANETDQIQILEQIQQERPEWEVRAIVA
jgi:hypothetical protein